MLKHNLIANYLGQGWVALMGLAFVPLYIRYIGIEAYGLIGLFAVLQTCLSLLDMGLSTTLNREMARFTGGAHNPQSIRDLLRSIEVVALSVALIMAVGIWAASGWLASDWLSADKLSTETIAQAISVMGIVAALRFIEGIYRSCIVGLQHQVLFNAINSGLATLRGLGAVGILAWISPTIEAFFLWQGIISILAVSILAAVTYRTLPNTEYSARFSLATLRGIMRFAGGIGGITILTLVLTQVDKVLLSKLLSLSQFGYYVLASAVAGALYMQVSPITTAWYPRLSQLHANNDQNGIIRAYHLGAQLVTVLMGSTAIVLAIFSEIFLQLWTQDTELTRRTAALVSLLALGNLLNGLMWMPYHTQFAHGWTGLALRLNMWAVMIMVPAILWATPRYGATGAAFVWIALNAGYLLVGVQFMYHRILVAEKWRWYTEDILYPLIGGSTASLLVEWTAPSASTTSGRVAILALASCMTLAAAAIAAPLVRKRLFAFVFSDSFLKFLNRR